VNTPSPVKSYEELEHELAEAKTALQREQARHKITQRNAAQVHKKLQMLLQSTVSLN
jgi:hypothetical protein